MSSSDENDVDVEGSEDLDTPSGLNKREHHNLLERKRRDHIKDSFSVLRDSIPSLQGEKASRAQILNKATEFIKQMRQKNSARGSDLERIRKDNDDLERQIRALEEEAGLAPMPLPVASSSSHASLASQAHASHDMPGSSSQHHGHGKVVAGAGASLHGGHVSVSHASRREYEDDGDDESYASQPAAKRAKARKQ